MQTKLIKKILLVALVVIGSYLIYLRFLTKLDESTNDFSFTEDVQKNQADVSDDSKSDQDASLNHELQTSEHHEQNIGSDSATYDLNVESHRQKLSLNKYTKKLTLIERRKLETLDTILNSKNDNDIRLDSDFKDLSATMKEALASYYQDLALEARNERGILAMLVARNLSSLEDIDFLKKVISEEPCLSLQDCKKIDTESQQHVAHHGDDTHNHEHHHGSKDEIDLSYPQMVVLYQIEQKLKASAENTLKQELRSVLTDAVEKGTPVVRRKAQDILQKYFKN